MSQLIACKTEEGVAVGVDSKAVDLDANGKLVELTVDRLHLLSDRTVILTGGAAAGAAMCQSLKRFVKEENLRNVDDIHTAALPFLATQYERFMRSLCKTLPIDPIHQLSFVLGGYTDKDPNRPFRLYLIWTKRKLPLLDSDEIETSFAIPRLIKFEYRLHQLAARATPLERVMGEVRGEMERRANLDEEIAEPLTFAYVTREGCKRL